MTLGRTRALGGALALLLLGISWASAANSTTPVSLDPCQKGQVAMLNKPYVIGFAFLPGGDETDWQALDAKNNTIRIRNPCNESDRALLKGLETQTSVYSLKVETLQLLRTDSGGKLLASTLKAATPVMTVVAYNGDFVTLPRVIVSNSGKLTQETGIVINIPLILQFTQGTQVVGYWQDSNCGSCRSNMNALFDIDAAAQDENATASNSTVSFTFSPRPQCITANCAVDIASCVACLAMSNASDTCRSYCSTSFNIGWAGTDSKLEPMLSQYILTQADDLSISALVTHKIVRTYNQTVEGIKDFFDDVKNTFASIG